MFFALFPIIWRGLGWLVIVIVFGCSFAFNLIFNAVLGDDYWDTHKWPFALSLWMSAILCFVVSRHIRKPSVRHAIDSETGWEMDIRPNDHSLFFIPVDYWIPILLVTSIVLVGIDLCA